MTEHSADTVKRDSYKKLADDMADVLNRMSQEYDRELCYSMAIDALDMHTERAAALSALTVEDAAKVLLDEAERFLNMPAPASWPKGCEDLLSLNIKALRAIADTPKEGE